jgi:hypothetical protein
VIFPDHSCKRIKRTKESGRGARTQRLRDHKKKSRSQHEDVVFIWLDLKEQNKKVEI